MNCACCGAKLTCKNCTSHPSHWLECKSKEQEIVDAEIVLKKSVSEEEDDIYACSGCDTMDKENHVYNCVLNPMDNVAAPIGDCTCYRNLSFSPAEHFSYCPVSKRASLDLRLALAARHPKDCPCLSGVGAAEHFKTCKHYEEDK